MDDNPYQAAATRGTERPTSISERRDAIVFSVLLAGELLALVAATVAAVIGLIPHAVLPWVYIVTVIVLPVAGFAFRSKWGSLLLLFLTAAANAIIAASMLTR